MPGRDQLVVGLRSFKTLAELRRSPFFAERGAQIESILSTPEVHSRPTAAPRLCSFVRVVQWNLEKGKRWERVIELLKSEERLKWADVLLLNEADLGMLRSGNVHVASEVAAALEMNLAFGPAHIELTKGTEGEAILTGENRASLQGNAVLSRFPIIEAKIVRLPACFDPFEFHEKRYGGRNCVWAKLRVGAQSIWVGATHLEVRNTPRCRALQMKHLLMTRPGGREESCLVGGDLNTNGFARGTVWRTFRSIARLLLRDTNLVKEELRHPERRTEPLFRVMEQAGFEYERLNSFEATASAPIGGLEDAGLLPGFIVRPVRRRLERYGGYLTFKLDWLLGRQVHALRSGEMNDPASGVVSSDPGCVFVERTGAARLSDHNPIFADVRL